MSELKIICPFCNTEYTAKMKQELWIAEGSYTPECVGSKMVSSIDIYCENCNKLVYKKEIEKDIDYLEWEKEENKED